MAQNRQGIYSDEAAANRLALLEPVSTYKVAPGDNMSRIAKNRGYSTEDMIAANPQIENPNEIEIDQEINLPTASTRV
jgi:LysM repeat protein